MFYLCGKYNDLWVHGAPTNTQKEIIMRTEKTKKSVKSVDTFKTRITLHSLFSNNQEIWVKNKKDGNIIMQIGTPPHIDKLPVPPGKDPVCLTERATHEMLKNCLDLVKLVNSGALELLDPGRAEEYYARNVARRDIVKHKIDRILNNTRDDVEEPRRVDGLSEEDLRPKSKPRKNAILDEMTPASKSRKRVTNVHPKINEICLKAKHGAIVERDALEMLLEQEAALKEADYQYLMNNGVFSGLKRWAKKRLMDLAEE